MKPLFERAGVDYGQWLALTRAMLRRDFRTRSMRGAGQGGQDISGTRALVWQGIFYSVFGIILSALLIVTKDLFFIGVVLCTYVMFMVGTAVLLDHSSALTAADDYAVLGFRPISSRTYFAVRLTNVLAYTLLLTTMVAYIPLGALVFKHGVLAGIAGFGALYGSSLGITFALLIGYAGLQRLVGANLLKQVLSYVQLAMSFMVYGGYFLVTKLVSKSFLASFTLQKTWWILLLPPTWFASYFDLAAGHMTVMTLVPSLFSVALLAAMSVVLTERLSAGFADRLGESAVAARLKSARAAKPARAGWLFRTGESRAMALLIRSQFRNDQKFRMGVLTIVPLTVLYIFQGISRPGGAPGTEFALVSFAILMFPTMLKMQLSRSDSFRASWIFFVAPVNRATVIRAAKNVVVAVFLLPYLAFASAAMIWATRDVWRVLIHISLLGLISHLVLQVTVFMDPELPFAKPMQKGQGPANIFMLFVLIGVVNVLLMVFADRLYHSLLLVGFTAMVVIVASVFVELLTKARVEEQAKDLEFVG